MVRTSILSANGIELAAWHSLTKSENAQSLILVHGIAEHSERYHEQALYFNTQGFNVYAFDLPGHGKSGGKRGDIHHFHEYTDSVLTVCEHFKLEKTYLYGHSMGGLIAYLALTQAPNLFINAVFHNPAFHIGGPLEKTLIFLINPIRPFLQAKAGKFPMPLFISPSKLVDDREIRDKIAKDPLMLKYASFRTLSELIQASQTVSSTPPVHKNQFSIIQTRHDPIVDGKRNIEYFRSHGVKCEVLEWGKHEPHNDSKRKEDWSLTLKLLLKN